MAEPGGPEVLQIRELPAPVPDRVGDVIRAKAVPAFFAGAKGFGRHEGGWSVSYAAGRFGDDILARDIVNYGGLWANTPEEAIYFVGLTDATGALLDGSRDYEIRFPPVPCRAPLPGRSGHALCTRYPTTTSSRTPSTAGTSTPRCRSNTTRRDGASSGQRPLFP